MRSRFVASIALACIALAGVVGLLEVVLTQTHLLGARKSWSQPDPVLGWRYTPGGHYWHFAENDHPIAGTINDLGWRDRERRHQKTPGTYRVVVLGDSYVEALQVELDSTFTALTEDTLFHRVGQPVEVMNLGRSGATQTEEHLILTREALDLAPDAVVLFFTPVNDISEVARATTDTPLRPFYLVDASGKLRLDTSFTETRGYRLRRAINPFKQKSTLASLVAERYNILKRANRVAAMGAPEAEPARIQGGLRLCTAYPGEIFAENYELCKRLIVAMAAICAERGIPFVLACVPWVYSPEVIDRYRQMDSSFDAAFFESDLGAIAARHDMTYLPLQQPFENYARETGRSLHWHHWNYSGHRVVAAALSDTLEAIHRDRLGWSGRR